MFGKMARNRNIILTAFIALWLVTLTLTLICGNGEDKTVVLVLSVIGPIIIYGFIWLMFKVLRKVAYPQYIKIVVRFIMVVAFVGAVMMLVNFIAGFPNGLSPSLPMGMATVTAMLDEEKRSTEAKTKE